MPDQLSPEELQKQFDAALVGTARGVFAMFPDTNDDAVWLKIAHSVIERYEIMRGGARVEFATTSTPANIILMPGTVNSHGIEVTHPVPLDSLLSNIRSGWTVQVYGKVIEGSIVQGEINVVISNATVRHRNTVKLADLAAAIVARQEFEAAHQPKPVEEGGDAH